jgi:hypothetical protein
MLNDYARIYKKYSMFLNTYRLYNLQIELKWSIGGCPWVDGLIGIKNCWMQCNENSKDWIQARESHCCTIVDRKVVNEFGLKALLDRYTFIKWKNALLMMKYFFFG